MNRRRILLSYLANSFSWELYSKTYFYNELVPTTINSKNVLNKAKIVKVSGNGVIENQLINPTLATQTSNGITITNNGDGSFTLTGTASAATYFTFLYSTWDTHYYLFKGINYTNNDVRWYDSYYGSYSSNKDFIFRQTNSAYTQMRISIRIDGGVNFSTPFTFYPQLIDLTLMFGTGNEPTTLTDNRIQNILNRGYIPFNLGKYKESDIGVVSSEPYNLFDGSLELGYIADGVNYNSTTDIRSINYVKVFGGKNYTFGADNFSSYARLRVYEFNANKQYLKTQTIYGNTPQAFSVSNETRYIRFALYNNGATMSVPTDAKMYVHLTGTRTGYAPHKTFTPITFKAQLGGAINSHNTMEITNSAYVFTRNVWKYTFNGSENFTRAGTNVSGVYRYWFYGLSNVKGYANSQIADILCDNLTADTNDHIYLATNDYSIGIFADGGFDFIVKSITDVATMQSYMNGKTMYYPLATPQVITIPRKHLGIVDLGSLNYSEYGSTSDYTQYFTNGIDALAKNNGNAYCSLFMLQNTPRVAGTMFIGMGNGKAYFRTRVGEYANATDFKNAMSGQYLFYETENEVADITNVVDIESGGTITTDSEVLANIELSVKCK